MTKTHVYLTKQLNQEIDLAARELRKKRSEVMREALKAGLREIKPKKSASAQALLDMSDEAARLTKGKKLPSDLSSKHNEYAWD